METQRTHIYIHQVMNISIKPLKLVNKMQLNIYKFYSLSLESQINNSYSATQVNAKQ